MQIPSAAYAFQIIGKPVSCQEFGQGHINQTLKMETDSGHTYILQRINQYVFQQPVQLMENICAITDYLRSKDADPRHSLHFIPAQDGRCYHFDENGQILDTTGKRSIGFAYIDSSVTAEDAISIDVRGKKLRAKIVAKHMDQNQPPYGRAVTL